MRIPLEHIENNLLRRTLMITLLLPILALYVILGAGHGIAAALHEASRSLPRVWRGVRR